MNWIESQLLLNVVCSISSMGLNSLGHVFLVSKYLYIHIYIYISRINNNYSDFEFRQCCLWFPSEFWDFKCDLKLNKCWCAAAFFPIKFLNGKAWWLNKTKSNRNLRQCVARTTFSISKKCEEEKKKHTHIRWFDLKMSVLTLLAVVTALCRLI